MRKPTAAILALSLTACGDVCWDLQNEGKCNHDQCYVPDHAPDETSDTGDTGDPPDDLACSALHRAKFSGQFMSCGGFVTDAEHCTQDAIHQWGLTDFDFHGSDSLVAKFDFVEIGDLGWTDDNWSTAVPFVIEHPDNFGGTRAGYASRGCCPQIVTGPDRPDDWIPYHPDCQSGASLLDTPTGWCQVFGGDIDTAFAGLCVYPCSDDYDCPEPTSMFCDLTRPDPMEQALGTCRGKATPTIPTQLADIGIPNDHFN